MWLPTENELKSHLSVNANCTLESWFLCRITRCNFIRDLVHTKISTSKVCNHVLSYFSASRSAYSMFKVSFSILGFKVNSNYLKLSVRLKDSGISDLLAPTAPTVKISGISLNWRGEWFRIHEQYGFNNFLLQYKNKEQLSGFSKQGCVVREMIIFCCGVIWRWASEEK